MTNILNEIRRWVDGEAADDIAAGVIKAHDNKSASELFLQNILRRVETVLTDEIVRLPRDKKAYVPEQFVVFLSAEADKNLRRDKREFFERGLSGLIEERAREMAGGLPLTTEKITVKISVNPLLEQEIEVRAMSSLDLPTVKESVLKKGETIKDYATVKDYATIKESSADIEVLLYVEIFRDDEKISDNSVVYRKNIIGRDDAGRTANLRLPTDNRKISRHHADLEMNDEGEILITARHKNPTIVGEKILRDGEQTRLEKDEEITIYDFRLKVGL